MLKAVLDTNVLVSATLTQESNEAKILDALRQEKFQLVTSPEILKEIRRVLFYRKIKKRRWMSDTEIKQLLAYIETFADVTPGELEIKVVRDPGDDKFVIAAVEGKAKYIVSGDKDLQVLGSYKGIKIVSPAEFLKILKL